MTFEDGSERCLALLVQPRNHLVGVDVFRQSSRWQLKLD
jgi:hypothetical protein